MSPTPAHHLFHPQHADLWAATLRQGIEHLSDQLHHVRGPATGVTPEAAAKPVADVDLDRPLHDVGEALTEMSRVYLDDAVWFHEPSYAAHLNCPVVIPALLAELYVSAVNTSLDTFDQSIGGTFVERHLIEWTAHRIGFPETATPDGIFTSGGTQSNLQALHLARDRHPVEDRDRLRVLASVDGHFSVQKAARLLGLHPRAVIGVPTDERHRMDPAALAEALAALQVAELVPMAVVATAGTTDFGSIDPLPEVADLCATHGAWLHVDAAYGGGLLVSPRHRDRLAGIERADSVTVDFHKTWFQPVSCSAVLVRDGATLDPVRWHADYLNPQGCAQPNQVDKSLQTTRRFDALKLWLTLRIMGPDAIGDYLDQVIELTEETHRLIAGLPDLEVACGPELSTVVFRFTGGDPDQHDELNQRIREGLYLSGQAMVAGTRVDDRQWLKLTLLNPMATTADVLAILTQVRDLGAELTGCAVATAEVA